MYIKPHLLNVSSVPECVNSSRLSATLRTLPLAPLICTRFEGWGALKAVRVPHSRADGHWTVTVQWEGLTQTSHVTMMDTEDLHGGWIRDLLNKFQTHVLFGDFFSDQKLFDLSLHMLDYRGNSSALLQAHIFTCLA